MVKSDYHCASQRAYRLAVRTLSDIANRDVFDVESDFQHRRRLSNDDEHASVVVTLARSLPAFAREFGGSLGVSARSARGCAGSQPRLTDAITMRTHVVLEEVRERIECEVRWQAEPPRVGSR